MPTDTKPRTRVVVEEVDKGAPKEPVSVVSPTETPAPSSEVPTKEPEKEPEEELDKPFAESVMPDKPGTEEPSVQAIDNGPNPLVIIIPGILLLGALLGGIVYFQKTVPNPEGSTPSPSAESSPSAEASPSAQTAVDLTKYKVNILNGSGIAGEAGRAKTVIEDAGFSVSATGNAADYSFTKTIISAKADVEKEFLDELKAALGEKYQVGANEELADSAKEDVVVTVGSSKK